MGSPVTFSGFNQIDFNLILNAVMAQARAPLARLETQQKTLETQDTALATLATKLAALDTASDSLKTIDSLSLVSATSSGAGVGVSSTAGTVSGTYDVIVSDLARAQVTASQTTYETLDTEVATSGTLTLTPTAGGAAVDIVVTASMTLAELAAAINANNESPARASVVQTAPGIYKLVLTGKDTGSTNAFTMTGTLAGPAALDFGINSQPAGDAVFKVNGLDVTSASNTVTDVIAGVTLSLRTKDPLTTITIEVTKDTQKAKDLVKKFVTAYNDVLTFAKDQSTAAAAGKASIGRDPLMRGLREGLRQATSAAYAGGSVTRLAGIGLGFDVLGKMTLDEAVFDKALATTPADVQTLFSGPAGTSGAFGAMSALINDYTKTGGLLLSARTRIDTQVRSIDRRLDTMEANLRLQRASLQREYTAADMAMTRMKAQSASLDSLGGGYQLF